MTATARGSHRLVAIGDSTKVAAWQAARRRSGGFVDMLGVENDGRKGGNVGIEAGWKGVRDRNEGEREDTMEEARRC
jgi:hypothetical protein